MYRTQGAQVEFRAARPQDCDQISDFIDGLSPRTQYLRFFARVAPPSSSLLRALCGGDSTDVVLASYRGRIIGHGMAADRAGGTSDIGLVIADDWQQRGVGVALLRIVVARAAARGAGTLVMDVLPSNNRMLGVIERRWPGAGHVRNSDSITIRAAVTAADLTAADLTAADLTAADLTAPAPLTGAVAAPAGRRPAA